MDDVEAKAFCREVLVDDARRAKSLHMSAYEWEELIRESDPRLIETVGDKELDHIVCYVWRIGDKR
jgi:hypothetical protein